MNIRFLIITYCCEYIGVNETTYFQAHNSINYNFIYSNH